MTETVLPTKPKILTIQPFKEKTGLSLVLDHLRSHLIRTLLVEKAH